MKEKESKRQKQFSSLIQQVLSEIFQKEGRNILGIDFVTVTHVFVSPDLAVAKIYLSFMMAKNPQELLETAESKKGEIRWHLGNKIGKQVRVVPELIFIHDDSADYADKMDKIFNSLNIPPEDNDDPENDQ